MTVLSTVSLDAALVKARDVLPGVAVFLLVAATAQFLSEHYGAPALLMALLLGMALNFLAEPGTRTASGVGFTARTVLRVGVALLGARISVELLSTLGLPMILMVASAVIVSILAAVAVGKAAGFDWRFSLLTGGAVAICGASAAMAISAILPRSATADRDLGFTVLGVTLLSTVAMVIYPIVAGIMGFDGRESGIFIGGTIHDVAQVVGAGFTISPEAGEAATVVKLFRVTMLAPVVLCASLMIRRMADADGETGQRPPLLPGFVIAFLALATMNSLGFVPEAVSAFAGQVSRWALLVAIAAVGIKTSIAKMLTVGKSAIALIVAETLFIGVFVLAGIHLID